MVTPTFSRDSENIKKEILFSQSRSENIEEAQSIRCSATPKDYGAVFTENVTPGSVSPVFRVSYVSSVSSLS